MTITDIISRFKKIKAERDSHWLGVWREVRRFVMPEAVDYLHEGGVAGSRLFDTNPIRYRARLASGMYSWMLDPTKRLIELKAANDSLNDYDDVRQFYAKLTKCVIEEIANSNYASEVLQMLNSCACGIDGVLYCEDADGKLNLSFIPIESICYLTSASGAVDTVFREMKLTARQMVQLFGRDGKLPASITADADNPDRADVKHDILHAVFPRKNVDSSLKDNKSFPFADYYIHLDTKTLIREGGYMEFPFFVTRFDRVAGESYGRGPGLNCLPDIKMLNRLRLSYIIAIERASDPDTLLPDGSLIDEEWNKEAGAVHIYNPGAAGAKPEYMNYPARLNDLRTDILQERQSISEGFFLDIFNPLGDLRNMSATEAEIRNEGKLVPFAPIVGNVHSDFLAPFVHRVVGILSRRGTMPPVPSRLAEFPEYKIEFVSRIALAIKQLESAAWVRVEGVLQGLLQSDPAGIDNFDRDAIIRDIARSGGINPDWLRSAEDRDAIRSERAAAAEQQQQAQMLAQGVSALPALQKTVEPGSILSTMQNGI